MLHEDHANSLRRMGKFHRPLLALPWIALVCERIADYFDKSSWFLSHDPPGDVPYCQIRPILGGHYFGDFQSLRCQALSGQPFGVVPPGEHFPLVYFAHYAVSWMPITAGFLLFASLSVTIAVMLVLRLRLRRLSPRQIHVRCRWASPRHIGGDRGARPPQAERLSAGAAGAYRGWSDRDRRVLVLFPVLILISGGIASVLIGAVLERDGEARHDGAELLELDN